MQSSMWSSSESSSVRSPPRRRRALCATQVALTTSFRSIPADTNRLLTLAVLADVAATLGDAPGAAELTELLAPHAGRHVLLNCFGGGGAYWGPVATQLGQSSFPSAPSRRWIKPVSGWIVR